MTIEINAERIAQIADITRAFAFQSMTVDSIVYDDVAETIAVLTVDADRYVFEIGSDDDELVFVNTDDSTDVVTVAILAE